MNQAKQIEATVSDGNALPTLPITDARFSYLNSASTDVRQTFKRFGWKEPNRKKQRAMKMALNS